MAEEEKHAKATAINNSEEEMPENDDSEEIKAETSEKKVSMKGQVKLEKKRSSSRIPKKPGWLRNIVMISKIEQESSVGENMPSVYEIPALREK